MGYSLTITSILRVKSRSIIITHVVGIYFNLLWIQAIFTEFTDVTNKNEERYIINLFLQFTLTFPRNQY